MLVFYTDGAYSRLLKCGGWGFVLVYHRKTKKPSRKKRKSGWVENTTNQQTELIAAIEAIRYFHKDEYCSNHNSFKIISDSKYVVNYLAEDWRYVWNQITNWTRSDGEPIANKELWLQLEEEIKKCEAKGVSIEFEWVKGHNGNKYNEQADKLAVASKKHIISIIKRRTNDERLQDTEDCGSFTGLFDPILLGTLYF